MCVSVCVCAYYICTCILYILNLICRCYVCSVVNGFSLIGQFLIGVNSVQYNNTLLILKKEIQLWTLMNEMVTGLTCIHF